MVPMLLVNFKIKFKLRDLSFGGVVSENETYEENSYREL